MKTRYADRARELRKRSTPAERTIWYWLRNRYVSGYKFRRQYPIDEYILDFYCPALKLCIEIDGTAHDTDARAAYDEERTRRLMRHGIGVLRLRNEHIRTQPDGAWELIVDAVERAEARRG